jgi:hypothetical protein
VWEGERRAGNEWRACQVEHQGRTIITAKQHATALEIAGAVRRHPVAARLLAEGQPELSLHWTHERTGLLCKARIDWWRGVMVELKTCRDPSPAIFASAFVRLGYHVQAAHYQSGLIAVGLGPCPVKVIAAQNVPPYDVVVYDVPLDAIVIGETAAESALDRIAACRRAKVWPGLAHDAEVELHLPAWAAPDFDDDPTWSVTEVTDARP